MHMHVFSARDLATIFLSASQPTYMTLTQHLFAIGPTVVWFYFPLSLCAHAECQCTTQLQRQPHSAHNW